MVNGEEERGKHKPGSPRTPRRPPEWRRVPYLPQRGLTCTCPAPASPGPAESRAPPAARSRRFRPSVRVSPLPRSGLSTSQKLAAGRGRGDGRGAPQVVGTRTGPTAFLAKQPGTRPAEAGAVSSRLTSFRSSGEGV